MIKKSLSAIIILFAVSSTLNADYVRISQIDSSGLLLSQKIKAFISVTNDTGEPVTNLDSGVFAVSESHNGKDFQDVDIKGFDVMSNYETGINFLLLIDNSGSMYRDLSGKKIKRKSETRIVQAKNALDYFLGSITNPKDKIGIAAYNSYYTLYSGLTDNKAKIMELVNRIEKPGQYDAFSEIYSSIYLAVDEFSKIKGRKAIIVLSDGIIQPYYKLTKKPHKIFGTKIFDYSEPVNYCQQEGVSVYAVNFGPEDGQKDAGLSKIAYETGGTVFDAHDQNQLKNVYQVIVNQILNEYLVTYNATMRPADKKYLKVDLKNSDQPVSATRFYFSSTIFGLPLQNFNFLLIIPFLLALVFMVILSKIDFQKKKANPNLEVLNAGSAKASTNFFTLDQNKKTIIGGDSNADMTLSGGTTKIREKHATVFFDDSKKQYTIIADGNISVNNKPVKTKLLEPGDVINVGGTTIVFDDGEVE
jgi:Ca-activated chloride channel homolog